MAEKCLTSNMAVFTGYWIVFSRGAELIYEIRNWRDCTLIRRSTVPGQCRSKGVDGGTGRGWLCMCSLMTSSVVWQPHTVL